MATKVVKRIKDPHSKNRYTDKTGDQKVGGSSQGLETDDNALDAAQKAGLYMEAREGKPKIIGIGRQINKAEKSRR